MECQFNDKTIHTFQPAKDMMHVERHESSISDPLPIAQIPVNWLLKAIQHAVYYVILNSLQEITDLT